MEWTQHMKEWKCPNCPWVHKAHPAYNWTKDDERAVEVHQEQLCPNKPEDVRQTNCNRKCSTHDHDNYRPEATHFLDCPVWNTPYTPSPNEVRHAPSEWRVVVDRPYVVVSAMCVCGNDECHFTVTAYDAYNPNLDYMNMVQLRNYE